MSRHIIVLTTVGSKADATKISRGLVEKKLAYCVNVIPAIQSTYHWQGEICVDTELLLIAKSQEIKFPALELWVLENHSYDTPELIAIPIVDGSADYLNCIDKWLGL